MASSIIFLGAFQRDDDTRVFTIAVDAPTSVDIRSVGYAGDPNSAVGAISSGGFDSYLTLFDSTGMLIAENDDGESAVLDQSTGQAFDAMLLQDLTPGTYSLFLTQYGNYALGPNVSYGFGETGNQSFTNDEGFAPGSPCIEGHFRDASGSCRNGSYAIEFLNEQGAAATYSLLDSALIGTPTPEPGTVVMISASIVAALLFKRSRTFHSPSSNVSYLG